MKNINYRVLLNTFLFSLLVLIFSLELCKIHINLLKNNALIEKLYQIEIFINKIYKNTKNVKDIEKILIGSLESVIYEIAIFKNDKICFTNFKNKIPNFKNNLKIYTKNNNLFYNDTLILADDALLIIIKTSLNYQKENKLYQNFIILCIIFSAVLWIGFYILIQKYLLNLNKKLDIFFKDAIHEIRTPLGVMQLNLEILSNLVKHNALNRAIGALKNLTQIYESIEYVIKHTKIKYKKQNINLSECLEERIVFFHILAQIKSLKLIIKIKPEIYINFNTTQLQRLIDNNISNAIKYSQNNSQIYINLIQHKKFGVVLFFANFAVNSVDKKAIFKRYYRGDEIKGGFGLGLSMVKQICKENKVIIRLIEKKDKKIIFEYFFNPKLIIKDAI